MPQNTRDVIQYRRTRIAELYLKGWYQANIAEEVGVNQSQVSRDLDSIRAEWKADRVRDFDAAKDDELNKIDNLERTYWAEWLRSQEDIDRKTTKVKRNGSGESKPDSSETSKTTIGRLGDPRYLEGVRWCIVKRCEILGLDAPSKVSNLVSVLITPEDVKTFRESFNLNY